MSFAGKLKTSLFWWLAKKRPFIINDEYQIELLSINRNSDSVRIRITNLKNQSTHIIDQLAVGDEQHTA